MNDSEGMPGGVVPANVTVPVSDREHELFKRVDSIIAQGETYAAAHANLGLTMTYWHVGREVQAEVRQEKGSDYENRLS